MKRSYILREEEELLRKDPVKAPRKVRAWFFGGLWLCMQESVGLFVNKLHNRADGTHLQRTGHGINVNLPGKI